MRSLHIPPLRHGLGRHSSMSTSQCTPRYPGMQTQRKPPRSSRQVPSFWQGLESHSLMLTSHRGPAKPRVQLQRNEPGVLTQRPWCSQGKPWAHSSTSSVQSTPWKPLGHEQRYVPSIGLVSQMAPAWHGLLAHASSKWHSSPVLPGAHWQ